jgi:hypothetical protein
MSEPVKIEHKAACESFFQKKVCEEGLKPLSPKAKIAIFVADKGPLVLSRGKENNSLTEEAANDVQFTFWVPEKTVPLLTQIETDDVATLGIELIKLLVHSDPESRMKVKVHCGLIELYSKGYFGVLTKGGPSVMKFLATQGLTSLGRVKDALNKMKEG